jgi:hypothetical protein
VASLWLFLNISWLFWLFSSANLAIFSKFNMATLMASPCDLEQLTGSKIIISDQKSFLGIPDQPEGSRREGEQQPTKDGPTPKKK